VRVLGIAALVTIGVGSALVAGAPDEPPAPGGNGWIAYGMQPEDGGDQDIWFVGLDSEPRRVVGSDTDNADQICPAFSSDHRRLAYGEVNRSAAAPATAVVVATVTSDGEVQEEFRVDVGQTPVCPMWSPGGDRIAFGVPLTSVINPERGAEGSEVWILTVADRHVTVLPDLLATDLEFSPDGSLLGIASGSEYDGNYGEALADNRIHLYEFASDTMRILEGTESRAGSFTWSPDGERIAYQGPDGLRVRDLATDDERVISERYGTLHGIGPVWSPDGESIVYQRCRPMPCAGEDHDVVRVWPDDLSADGTAREEILPLVERLADGSDRPLKGPYWVTWSPDGEHLLFAAWSSDFDPLLGVIVAAPGSSANLVVTAQDVTVNPVYEFGPFVPMQSWGRLPSGAATPTTAPDPSGPRTTGSTLAADPSASSSASDSTPAPSAQAGSATEPITLTTTGPDPVPITVTIDPANWAGEPGSGVLCRADSGASCAPGPDGAGLEVFAGPEYEVYGEACQWSTTRPDTPAATVDEFAHALAIQGSRDESAPEDITLDRHGRKRIVLRMHPMDFEVCDGGHPALFGRPGDEPARSSDGRGQIEEVWAVDRNGLIVVLVGTYYPDPAGHRRGAARHPRIGNVRLERDRLLSQPRATLAVPKPTGGLRR
jgi:hypothetical protein